MIFPLYKVELKGKVSVIVKDAFSYGYRKVMKIPKNAEMYNSGVVLFDWQKYQQANYGERCYSVVDTVDTYGENNSRWSRHTRYRITKKVEIMEPRYNLVSSYYEFTYRDYILGHRVMLIYIIYKQSTKW